MPSAQTDQTLTCSYYRICLSFIEHFRDLRHRLLYVSTMLLHMHCDIKGDT